MHRRAKTHRDNFRGLTIYIAGGTCSFGPLTDFQKLVDDELGDCFLEA